MVLDSMSLIGLAMGRFVASSASMFDSVSVLVLIC
jgi:hypothetical protein